MVEIVVDLMKTMLEMMKRIVGIMITIAIRILVWLADVCILPEK